jgi:TetR/AcrR family transcriptional regulator, mexJK operon transcriptional repressor
VSHATTSHTVIPKKRGAITAAAAEMFAAHGYEGTNLDHIAERAGVSKQTIYNQFGGKEALFRAIVAELAGELTSPLEFASEPRDLRRVLIELGDRCLEVSSRPSSLALHRLIVGVAPRFPDLGPAIYSAGAARMIDSLAKLIGQHARAGKLAVPDSVEAAEQFFGMLIGFHHFRALLGLPALDIAEQRRHVVRTVDAFLRLYRSPARTAETR